jgi:drug/metabolite transporter (DMT)-like permease
MFFRSGLRGEDCRTRIGIFLILSAGLIFAANDVLAKILLADVSVGQVLFIRCIPALLLLLPFLTHLQWPARLRASTVAICLAVLVLSAVDITCHYAALAYPPLADVATFYMASPTCVAALSVILLREPITRRQVLAVALGFLGVVIALRPSADLSNRKV